MKPLVLALAIAVLASAAPLRVAAAPAVRTLTLGA
jgi:hypothetical protein